MEQNLITIIVATYKKTEGLIPTIESIRLQEYLNKELIITDDGSGNEIINIIDQYLNRYRNDFIKVTFIKNESNIGTVKNIQNAYKLSSGNIIKAISPGDLLYDRFTLSSINQFFNEKKPLIACGIPRTYNKQNNRIVDKKDYHFKTYSNLDNFQKTYSNVLFGNQYLTGATLVFHKDIFEKANLFLPDTIKYAEDLIQLLAVLKGIQIHLMNNYLIWYEHGTGISTNNSSLFSNKLLQDQFSFYQWLLDDKKLDKKILRDIKIKYESFFRKTKISKLTNYLKSYPFLKFVLMQWFEKKKLRIEIEVQHKNFCDNQGDGFIDLLTK